MFTVSSLVFLSLGDELKLLNMLHVARWQCRTQKNRHLGTIAQLCRAASSQLRHVSTGGNFNNYYCKHNDELDRQLKNFENRLRSDRDTVRVSSFFEHSVE